jgi:hypothetical protein
MQSQSMAGGRKPFFFQYELQSFELALPIPGHENWVETPSPADVLVPSPASTQRSFP